MSRFRCPARSVGVAVALAGLVALAACGSSTQQTADVSSASSSGSESSTASPAASSSAASTRAGSSGSTAPSSGGPTKVTITITADQGCVTQPNTVAAGPVDFTVKNVDATGVTEVHLVADQRIRGERENLAPGFSATFSATLDGGAYEIYCPGATVTNTPFTVTGQSAAAPSGDVSALLDQATVDYASYVDSQMVYLVGSLPPLVAAINQGDLKAAQVAYAAARPFYEKIEPVAESFGDLDPNIDAREGDVPAAEWRGFHRIEKALFVQKSTKAAAPYTAPLVADVAKLAGLSKQLTADTKAKNGKGYKPDEVANGAAGLLGEVQKSKITGEEERYSHIDILDFDANVEGSVQAFAVLKPALDVIDPTLVGPITAKFDALSKLLDSHRDATALGGVMLYTQLSKADIKALADALLAVQEPLSQISAKVAAA